MGVVNWSQNVAKINRVKSDTVGITGTDWLSFFDVLGWSEG